MWGLKVAGVELECVIWDLILFGECSGVLFFVLSLFGFTCEGRMLGNMLTGFESYLS